MFPTILIDILILLAVGVPLVILHRRWSAWVDLESRHARVFDGPKRFGFRSWAARAFVLDKPVAHVKEQIDGLPEMSYAEAAALITARGRTGSFMALAPLTGKQVFETGIEVEWLSQQAVEISTNSYADWPLNALDEAELPAKQSQMVFQRAVLKVEPHGEDQTLIGYELEMPAWAYVLGGAIVLLIGWLAWLVWRFLDPTDYAHRINLAVMAVLTGWILLGFPGVLRLQSIALMDGVIGTFGSPVPPEESGR